ncbi:MAG: type II secretion system protein GspN [Bdellovibrionota bacterium]
MNRLEPIDFEPTRTAMLPEGPEKRSRLFQRVGVAIFGVVLFFAFLLLKLPEARIQNLIVAHIRILAQQQGFLFSAEKVKIGMLLGPSLKFENIELKSLADERQSFKIPYLKIRPQLLSLISKVRKASITAELQEGEVSGAVGASAAAAVVDLDLDTVRVDSARGGNIANLLKDFAPVDVSGLIDGQIDVALDFENAQKSTGKIQLELNQITLPAQSVYGFNLPKVGIGKSKIDLAINQGQLQIRAFEVGKDIKTDDIVARVTGDGTLDRRIERSRINAKANFELSKNLIQSLPLLDALLGTGKTPDGKYAYRLSGTLSALEAQPGR